MDGEEMCTLKCLALGLWIVQQETLFHNEESTRDRDGDGKLCAELHVHDCTCIDTSSGTPSANPICKTVEVRFTQYTVLAKRDRDGKRSLENGAPHIIRNRPLLPAPGLLAAKWFLHE